jgi:hypothetical protein
MKDEPTWADEGAAGSNSCAEQTLWDKELCCLVETYPARFGYRRFFRWCDGAYACVQELDQEVCGKLVWHRSGTRQTHSILHQCSASGAQDSRNTAVF